MYEVGRLVGGGPRLGRDTLGKQRGPTKRALVVGVKEGVLIKGKFKYKDGDGKDTIRKQRKMKRV